MVETGFEGSVRDRIRVRFIVLSQVFNAELSHVVSVGNAEVNSQAFFLDTAPKDVYARLKALENKVLKLEAVSPEYFQGVREQRNNYSTPPSNTDQQMSLDQIDDRIKFLKQKLLNKKMKIG